MPVVAGVLSLPEPPYHGCMNQTAVKRPGTEMMKFGALLTVLGVVIVVIAQAFGWFQAAMILIGIVLVLAGFGRRILAALEDKPRTRDDLRVDLTDAE